MQVEIRLKNYRCFPDERPLRLCIARGLTALVGVNNSGKSSLLKFLYEFRGLFAMLFRPTRYFLSAVRGNLEGYSIASSVSDINEVFSNINNRDLKLELSFTNIDPKTDPKRFVIIIPKGKLHFTAEIYDASGYVDIGEKTVFDEEELRNSRLRINLAPIFQTFQILYRSIFIPSFRNAINIGATSGYFDIDVGQQFIATWRRYKTGDVKKHNEATYALTDNIKTIFGFNDLEINPSDDNQTLQLFIDGKSYKLSEIGSGLAQFILVFANAAIKEPSYILIDEPELNLHPSLQLDFLTSLASYASEGVIFATHSIGLARACADQIYSFRKLGEGESEVREFEATPRLSQFLGELSFGGYRDLGSDKILLVEGPGEVKTIQQFLRKYKKDHEIVLLPLGGSQMINGSREEELAEITRISDKVSALIDSERKASGESLSADRQAFLKICEKLGIRCHVLKLRATENYVGLSRRIGG